MDLPLRERIARKIMPAAFGDHRSSWKSDAQRRSLALADEIIELLDPEPHDSGAAR
jgi:hypothetical protein